jgi:hypothetical protein
VSALFASVIERTYSRRRENERPSNTTRRVVLTERFGEILRHLDLSGRLVVGEDHGEHVADRDVGLGHDRLLHAEHRPAAHADDRTAVGNAVERRDDGDTSLPAERLDHLGRHVDPGVPHLRPRWSGPELGTSLPTRSEPILGPITGSTNE